jgi:ADP-ribose pyrophosphatase YjhB (NUDIX family)
MTMEAKAHIEALEAHISEGARLPEEVFLFLSRHTPLVCVDLLIRNGSGESLLTWRDDLYFGAGWHLPGGVVRFREPRAERIRAVVKRELGAEVSFDPAPLAIQEFVNLQRRERGHHVCFLVACTLDSPPDAALRYPGSGVPTPGQWKWHRSAPPDLLGVHTVYRDFLDGKPSTAPAGPCASLPWHEAY